MSYQGKPLTTYEEWLEILDVPSSPTTAEAYRQYETRWRTDNPPELPIPQPLNWKSYGDTGLRAKGRKGIWRIGCGEQWWYLSVQAAPGAVKTNVGWFIDDQRAMEFAQEREDGVEIVPAESPTDLTTQIEDIIAAHSGLDSYDADVLCSCGKRFDPPNSAKQHAAHVAAVLVERMIIPKGWQADA